MVKPLFFSSKAIILLDELISAAVFPEVINNSFLELKKIKAALSLTEVMIWSLSKLPFVGTITEPDLASNPNTTKFFKEVFCSVTTSSPNKTNRIYFSSKYA